MHGTYLNEEKIMPDLPYPVKSGDTIRFGVDVVAKAGKCDKSRTFIYVFIPNSNTLLIPIIDTYVAPCYRITFSETAQDEDARLHSPVGRTFVAPVFESDISNSGSEDDDSDDDSRSECMSLISSLTFSSYANFNTAQDLLPGSSQTNPITFDDEVNMAQESLASKSRDAAKSPDEYESDFDAPFEEDIQSPKYSLKPLYSPQSPRYSPSSPVSSPPPENASDEEDYEPALATENKLKPNDCPTSPELGAVNPVNLVAPKNDMQHPDYSENAEHHSGRNIFKFIAGNVRPSQDPTPSAAVPAVTAVANSFDLFDEPWTESDPFAPLLGDSYDISSSNTAANAMNIPYPDFKNIPLPSVSKLQNLNVDESSTKLAPINISLDSGIPETFQRQVYTEVSKDSISDTPKKTALSVMDLVEKVTSPCPTSTSVSSAKKRKADEITGEVSNSTVSVVQNEESSSGSANIAETLSPGLDSLVTVNSSAVKKEAEPSKKRARFNLAQFAGGVVLGAFGAVAALVALPEDYFAA